MSDSLPPMTDEALGDIENRLNAVEQFNPLPWTSEYDSFGVEINFGPTFKIEDANGDLVFATDSIQNLADLLRFAPRDLRDLLDENARLNAELSDFREMAVLNTKSLSRALDEARAELDRVIREAAADKAKLAAVEKAVRDSYPWECDSPTHNRICHLRALTPVNIALGGSEMPRPPAEGSTVPTPSIHAQSDEQAADDSTEGATE